MNLATAEQVKAPADGLIEVVLTLRPGQYREMGKDLEEIRSRLDLPSSASITQVIAEAVHRQATSG